MYVDEPPNASSILSNGVSTESKPTEPTTNKLNISSLFMIKKCYLKILKSVLNAQLFKSPNDKNQIPNKF